MEKHYDVDVVLFIMKMIDKISVDVSRRWRVFGQECHLMRLPLLKIMYSK